MAIVGTTTTAIEIPHEPGETMTFRALSGMELDEARQAAVEKQLRLVATLRPETVQALQSSGRKRDDNPRSEFDVDAVLNKAIVGWTYDVPCSPEMIGQLDAVTRDWAFATALSLNTRSPGEGTGSEGG